MMEMSPESGVPRLSSCWCLWAPLLSSTHRFWQGSCQALWVLGPALCILWATRTGGRVGVSHQEGH